MATDGRCLRYCRSGGQVCVSEEAEHTVSVRNRVLMTRVLRERVSADDSGSCWELG